MLTCSNYSTKIESDAIRRKYVYTMQSNQTFAAYAKIKRDCKTKAPPHIIKEGLVYFEHDFRESCQIDKVFNIDLKSAYATILFNAEFISEDSFKYLSRLPKHDRLAAVGMLASKRRTFGFSKRGDIEILEDSISPLENFFYFAVKETYAIMSVLKMILGDKYLFTWVDGIYFLPDMEKLIACEDYLRSIKMRHSEEILIDWHIRVVKGAVKLWFIKEGKVKQFCLPARETEFARLMSTILHDRSAKPETFKALQATGKKLAKETYDKLNKKST
jgi:hypothetical protein